MCLAPSADRSVVSKPCRERARLRRRFQATRRGHRRQGRGQGQESWSSRGGSPFRGFANCAAPILPFQRRVGNEEFPLNPAFFGASSKNLGAKTSRQSVDTAIVGGSPATHSHGCSPSREARSRFTPCQAIGDLNSSRGLN